MIWVICSSIRKLFMTVQTKETNVRQEIEAIYPLSSMQEGMLFHALYAPESELYFQQQTADLHGLLNEAAFQEAWQKLAQRHAILRTLFVWEKQKQPIQVVRRRAEVPLLQHDWRGLAAADQATRWQELLAADRAAGFQLNKTPIARVTLVRLDEQHSRFVWSYHHILWDGWTTNLLFKELFQLYESLVGGETTVLPPARPYQSFIAWLGQQNETADEPFWRDYLRGFAAPTPLNIDRKIERLPHQSANYDERRFKFPAELAAQLQTFARDHRLTLSNVIQAAWAVLLSRYSSEADVVYGATVSGRSAPLPGVEQMAGMFINTLPIRAQLDADQLVLDWLQMFQQNQLDVQQHEHSPLVKIQSWSELPKDQALFASLLAFENYPASDGLGLGSNLRVERHPTVERTNYPLTIRILPTADTIHFFFIYDEEQFEAAAIERMFGHWQTLLSGMMNEPDTAVGQLNMLSPAEQEQLLVTWNQSDLHFVPELCIHEQVEQQAMQTPDAPALTFEGETLTYRQLNERANQLAHHLQSLGVQPDDLVALYLERSLEMVIAILGVLKAGGAYLPMDVAYPTDRLNFMLEDAKPVALLTQKTILSNNRSQFTFHNSESPILLDSDWPQIAAQPSHNPTSRVRPSNRAYVIYTSGSTGKPKGVLVTHANVMRLFQATDHWFNFTADDVWTLFHSYAFDFSVWEIWGALLYGGRVVVVPYLTSRSPHNFYRLLVAEGVTVLNQTPSAFRQLIQAEAEVGQDEKLALRYVIFGGEALELNTLQPWFDRHGDQKPQLINMYGITETTVHVTYRPIFSSDVAQAPGSVIGQAIPDLQLYILDPQQQPVPIGVPGEIYVGGAGVAAGYLNRPGLTAERFVAPPFDSPPAGGIEGGRVYRTGDLARRLPDGDIEYLGRIDHQVKIRGFRVELGEIEAALGSHTAVRQALVLVQENAPGEKRLVAYLVLDPAHPITVSELRRYLQPKLPAYMIPAAFVLLDAFPLTTNGKIDRRALPQPDEARPALARPYTPPRSRAEELLANIWSRVLNVARVGIDDNYFELGGDSIRSIQVLAQARQAGLEFTLADLFNLQTIGRLSEQIARIELVEAGVAAIEAAPFSLIDQADREKLPSAVADAYPLSKLQAGMLFHSELAADTAVYHNVTSWQIEASFDGDKLAAAVQQLAQKHAILRTSFDLTNYSEPLQLVWPQVQIPVARHDLRQMETAAQEAEIRRWIEQAVANKFDWAQPPLLRFHFFQRSETAFQMIMAEHHAILDGWSVASLVTELFQTYDALLKGTTVAMVTAVPYREFVAAEQRTLTSKTARTFWQQTLAESSVSLVPRLPLPDVAEQLPETAVQQIIIPAAQVAQLSQVAQQAGVPLKSVLLAAHLKILACVCGQRDVLTGLVMNGRTEHSGSDRALGLFLNTVPFRQKLTPGSWLDLIRQTFATEKNILPYRRFPLAEIQQMSGGQPLFEVPFNYLHFHVFDGLAHHTQVNIVDQQFYGHANFALAVEAELNSAQGVLALRLEYNPAEFGAAQIERLAGYYTRTLAAVAAEPEALHQTFCLLSPAEQQQLVVDWNATETAVPDLLIHEWVAQIAAEMGEQTAVVMDDLQLTYAELNAKANQLAHYLQAKGVGPETFVAVYLNRSPEIVIAALAVLKAGGAYLPIDPAYPPERIRFMLTDAGISLVLTTEALHALPNELRLKFQLLDFTILRLDTDWPKIAACSERNPDGGVTIDNAAYVIYTSGSTGQPKGVVVTHRGVPNLAQAQQKAFAIGPESRVLQFAAFGFDASVSEIFVTLTASAALVLAEAEAMLPGPELVELVKKQDITAVTLPPSALAILDPADFPSLKTVVTAGEACSAEVVARWSVGRHFVNAYGPTEATVCATTAVLSPADAQVHIGRPIDNVQLYILSEGQQPVPVGTPGELYVGGMGVARGYLNRPGLTKERFVEDPFDKVRREQGNNRIEQTVTLSPDPPVTPACLYRTGDLARYLPDGNIEFLGRIDHQVKIRGHRIELGEIETVLRRQMIVQDALVLARDDAGTGLQLVAYVVGPDVPIDDLRAALSQRLPAYMVPAAFVRLDAFPLTPNGKIDRDALPAPTATAVAEYEPPRNDVETVTANLWAETLKLPRVGIHNNFFELGGHSLLATQLITRLRQTLRVELPLRALFDAPTIAALTDVMLQPPNNRVHVEKIAQLLIKLSQLSDEEAAQLLGQQR